VDFVSGTGFCGSFSFSCLLTLDLDNTPWLADRQPVGYYVAYPTDCRSARPRTSRPTVRHTGRRTAGAGTCSGKLQAKYQYLCTDKCDQNRIYPSQKNSLHGRNLVIVMVRRLCKQIFLHDLL